VSSQASRVTGQAKTLPLFKQELQLAEILLLMCICLLCKFYCKWYGL